MEVLVGIDPAYDWQLGMSMNAAARLRCRIAETIIIPSSRPITLESTIVSLLKLAAQCIIYD